MLLPGGLWHDGERRRTFAFKPLTGEVELAMTEGAEPYPSWPVRVTAVLAAALEHVGGESPVPQLVRDLCVGDRQFLVRQLAAHLGSGGAWISAECGRCGECFDVYVEQSALPVKEAGDEAPWATAEISLGRCRLRLPTGADQEAVAGIEDDARALRELVGRCLVAVAGEPVKEGAALGRELGDADLAAVEAALEAVAPEVALEARTQCLECGQANDVRIDPYWCLRGRDDELFDEINTLALSYHWSEAELLGLPRKRRRLYLKLVDRARGMVQ